MIQPEWSLESFDCGVPGYTEDRFYHESGRVEIAISPFNGMDDGKTPATHFGVNIYEKVDLGEYGEDWALLVGKETKTHSEALQWALHFASNLLDLLEHKGVMP